MKQTICDSCGEPIVSATETHAVIYCDNSTRRVDCCNKCSAKVRTMDPAVCILLARAVLGMQKK